MEYKEIFKRYRVYANGDIYRITDNKKVGDNSIDEKGYKQVHLVDEQDKYRTFKVHRIVALSWLDNPNNLPVVHHKDNNNQNNHYTNLEWCTQKQNHNYSEVNNKVGENHYKAKLTKEEVITIRNSWDGTYAHCIELSKEYNCADTNILKIVRGQTWKSLPMPDNKTYEKTSRKRTKSSDPKKKLNDELVSYLRQNYDGSFGWYAKKAEELDIDVNTLRYAVQGKTWKHLPFSPYFLNNTSKE